MRSVTIVGIGRVGGALSLALADAGYKIDSLVYRDQAIAKPVAEAIEPSPRMHAFSDDWVETSDYVIIAVGDPEIASVSSACVGKISPNSVVLHTSGSLTSEALKALAESGSSVGSMHPLISIANSLTGKDSFRRAYFCIEGGEAAKNAASEIALALGGVPFSIETEMKSLYHAAAVMSCGHLVALVDAAIEMLTDCGIERKYAQNMLLPLIRSTIDNLASQGVDGALTGSFARADLAAVERHLEAISLFANDEVKEIYSILGDRSIEISRRSGADPNTLDAIRDQIVLAKRKSG
ncbi:MAG: Rossmann-like and DUF2520 domain-containing protein [Blastocatellia bacterium]